MNNNHTFVICAYGDSKYLEECIISLKNQTRASQIVLYTSTPSEYILDMCSQHNIPIYHSNGGSIGKDWNNALSFVKTKYVTIAHQDDVYEPTYLEKVIEKIDDNTLIAFSDYYEYKNGQKIYTNTNLKIKRILLNILSIFPSVKWWRNRVLSIGNPICCPAVTYNLTKLYGFQFNQNLKVSIDWYAWYCISKYSGRFDYIPEMLMFHRIHQESETSNTIQDKTRSHEDLFMYSLFWPKFIAKFLMKFYEKSQESNF